MNPSDCEPAPINTEGGDAIDVPVNTAGDFVGHDQTIHGDQVYGDKILGDKVLGDKTVITEETAYNVQGLSNPYLGLRAFGYADRAIYAGREQLAQETVRQLTAPGVQQTLLFITGASGSGKSSFAQAGLISLLESHYAAYQQIVRHAVFRPSSQPLVMLADALRRLHPDLTSETLAAKTTKEQIDLLIIDQFEELFIQSEANQRAPFCDFLSNLPDFAASHTHILITLRVDYLDELFAIQPLWAIAKAGVELRAMEADDLRNAIQKPLQVNHPQKRFAPELLDRLVQDAGADAALLPLLQVTLAELWKTGRLVLSNYHSLTDAIGQRAELVYTFSDYSNAAPKTQRPAPDQYEIMSILLDLINVSVDGADRRDARQRRTRQELEQGSTHRPRLIEELVNARLLSAATETRNGEEVEVIDIIHESLIENWDRLRSAIEEQRQQLQRRARFKMWLGEWLRNGRQDGYLLLTDMQLAEARALVEGRDIEVQGVEAQEFHWLSLEHQETERQKELKRVKELAEARQRRVQAFRWGTVIATILTLLALVATGVAVNQRQVAINERSTATIALATSSFSVIEVGKERDRADQQAKVAATHAAEAKIAQSNAEHNATIARARQLAAQSDTVVQQNYQLSLLLAAEAVTTTWHSTYSLKVGMADSAMHRRLTGEPGGMPLFGYSSTAFTDFSMDGQWLANGSLDHNIRIWRVEKWEEEPRVLRGHNSDIMSLTFSPDSRWLASGSAANEIRIWRIGEWDTEPVVLKSFGSALAFSADNKWLASGSADNTIRMWRVGEWEIEPIVLHENRSVDSALTFSTDNKWLASGSADNTIRMWRVGEWEIEPVVLRGHKDRISALTFSTDGKWLVSGSISTVYVWHVGEWETEPIILQGSGSALAFSADNKWLASGSDTTVQVWGVGDWKAAPVLLSYSSIDSEHLMGSYITSLTFSTDGKWLMSANAEESSTIQNYYMLAWRVEEWEVKPVVLRGHNSYISSLDFDVNNKWLASSGNDNTVRIWHIGESQVSDWAVEPIVLAGHEDDVLSLAFSIDGKWLASGSNDDIVQIWHAGKWQVGSWTVEPIVTLQGKLATFSTDSKWLASVDSNNILRIWEIGKWGAELMRLHGQAEGVTSLAFSTDRKWLVTGSWGYSKDTLWLWNLEDKDVSPLSLHVFSYGIMSLAFSPDNNWFAGVTYEGDILIWRVGDWKVGPINLSITGQYIEQVRSVIFSPDSKWLAIGTGGHHQSSRDFTVQVWKVPEWKSEPIELGGYNDVVMSVAFSANSKWLATLGFDTTLRVWQTESWKEDSIVIDFYKFGGTFVAFSTDDNYLVSTKFGSDQDSEINIWLWSNAQLVATACRLAGRNFSIGEWQTYIDTFDAYRPICPYAPIPPDTIYIIQQEARQQIRSGQTDRATQRLTELNSWLQVNGQFKNYGVDVPAFVAEVSATATAEAQPAQ